MDKFYKNVILCGEIDYYCLLCDESLENKNQLVKHIRRSHHRRNNQNLSYVPKYRKNFIYKIGSYYYCEICNCVSSPSEIKDHIDNEKHKFRKSNRQSTRVTDEALVERNQDGLIKCYNRTMTKLDWHGVVDNHCVLCNAIVENVEHIKQRDHMIALVQTRIITINGKDYHRKINDDTLYCFLCKKLFAKDSLHEHDELSHVKEPDMDPFNELNIGRAPYHSYTEKTLQDDMDKDDIFKALIEVQRKHFNIDLVKMTARCFECKIMFQNVTVSFLISHRLSHNYDENDENELTEENKRKSELATYGRNHFIKLDAEGDTAYCFLCDVSMSASFIIIKGHLRGTIHESILFGKRYNKPDKNDVQFDDQIQATPLHEIISMAWVNQLLKVICINGNSFLDIWSFLLISPLENKEIRCLICDKTFDNIDIVSHCMSKDHKTKLITCFVMNIDSDPHLKDEFVRKVKPDLFHCGTCNQLILNWDATHLHLKSTKHRAFKHYNRELGHFCNFYCKSKLTEVSSINSDMLLLKLGEMHLFKLSIFC